jgi:hypothetical protein
MKLDRVCRATFRRGITVIAAAKMRADFKSLRK